MRAEHKVDLENRNISFADQVLLLTDKKSAEKSVLHFFNQVQSEISI